MHATPDTGLTTGLANEDELTRVTATTLQHAIEICSSGPTTVCCSSLFSRAREIDWGK
jgi:hypothetical protein